MQYTLRPIVKSKTKIVYGLTVPSDVAIFFKQVNFTVEKSGTSIIFTSGTCQIPTKKDIERYEFGDCRIK